MKENNRQQARQPMALLKPGFINMEDMPEENCDEGFGQPVNTPQAIAEPMALPPSNNPRGNIQFLTIIGQIEGHSILPPHNKTTKNEHVITQLVMCAENPEVDGMLIK